MNYNMIMQMGAKLRASDIKTISTDKLFRLLRQVSNCHRNDTIRHYAKLLKDEGFIKINKYGAWEILR